MSEGGNGVAGVLTIGFRPAVDGFERPLMLTPGIELRAPRVLFIGQAPGQIYSWPTETPAREWYPVWAVPMGRRGHAVYCGSDIGAAAPVHDQPDTDRDRVRLWKHILWHRRKRIREPEEPALVALWRSYVEAARRV